MGLEQGSPLLRDLAPFPLQQLDGNIWEQGPQAPQDRGGHSLPSGVGWGPGVDFPELGLLWSVLAVHSLTGFPEEPVLPQPPWGPNPGPVPRSKPRGQDGGGQDSGGVPSGSGPAPSRGLGGSG